MQLACIAMASPVADAWLANKLLSARGAVGQLVTVAGASLTRADVIANGSVLGPLLFHMGAKVSIDALTTIVEEFFFLARPRGKPPLSRSLLAIICQECYKKQLCPEMCGLILSTWF